MALQITNFKNIRLGQSMMTNLKQFCHFFMITVTSAQPYPLEREKNKNKKRNHLSFSCFNLLRSTNVQSLLKQGKTRLKVCRGCQAFHSEASFSFSFIDHSFILARSMEGSVSKTLVTVGQNQLIQKNMILGMELKIRSFGPPVAKLWPNIFRYVSASWITLDDIKQHQKQKYSRQEFVLDYL